MSASGLTDDQYDDMLAKLVSDISMATAKLHTAVLTGVPQEDVAPTVQALIIATSSALHRLTVGAAACGVKPEFIERALVKGRELADHLLTVAKASGRGPTAPPAPPAPVVH